MTGSRMARCGFRSPQLTTGKRRCTLIPTMTMSNSWNTARNLMELPFDVRMLHPIWLSERLQEAMLTRKRGSRAGLLVVCSTFIASC
jgi:hypothetical protein